MQISISGVHTGLGDAFKQHVEDVLTALCEKHNIEPIEINVQLAKDGFQFRSDISSHLGRGVMMRGHGIAPDAHISLDAAVANLSSRLFRHKKRLLTFKHHHGTRRQKQMAPYYVLTPEEATEPEGESKSTGDNSLAPPIIAEMQAEIQTFTVGEAVMHLDLSEEPALLFRNDSNNQLNLVYRRSDGNIGWIDPQNK